MVTTLCVSEKGIRAVGSEFSAWSLCQRAKSKSRTSDQTTSLCSPTHYLAFLTGSHGSVYHLHGNGSQMKNLVQISPFKSTRPFRSTGWSSRTSHTCHFWTQCPTHPPPARCLTSSFPQTACRLSPSCTGQKSWTHPWLFPSFLSSFLSLLLSLSLSGTQSRKI